MGKDLKRSKDATHICGDNNCCPDKQIIDEVKKDVISCFLEMTDGLLKLRDYIRLSYSVMEDEIEQHPEECFSHIQGLVLSSESVLLQYENMADAIKNTLSSIYSEEEQNAFLEAVDIFLKGVKNVRGELYLYDQPE